MITEETGVIPEESGTEYVADRVRTTAAVSMGLTAGCAQCHDHKYDLLTQREFFQLFTYFNQLPEAGIARGKQKNATPELRLPSPEQTARQADLARVIAEVEANLASLAPPKEIAPEQVPASALRPGLEVRRTLLRDVEKQHFNTIPTTMVMQDMLVPRDTFIQVRGQYDPLGDKVTPGVPRFLPPLPNDAPPNRLALARWLVDGRHPLTARVAVNRLWRQLFGHGIVTTVEDFGLQGAWPSHPELLDWLAVEYRGKSSDERRVPEVASPLRLTFNPQPSTLNLFGPPNASSSRRQLTASRRSSTPSHVDPLHATRCSVVRRQRITEPRRSHLTGVTAMESTSSCWNSFWQFGRSE